MENEKETQGKIYEVSYLLVPSISEENLGAEVSTLKDSLLNFGVIMISDEYPKMIDLAYEMCRSISNKNVRFTQGYFGWFKFEASPEKVSLINEMFDKNEKIIRYLLIKTVRENTMFQKRVYKPENSRRRIVNKTEESGPINEEVIDKEIDALVVE